MRHNAKRLLHLEKMFHVSSADLKKIMKDFLSEMRKGLSGKKSSLKMIPAYTDRPTGDEKGRFLALDLGGTNFRIMEVELKGSGRYGMTRAERFVLDRRHTAGTDKGLFAFLARSISAFIRNKKINIAGAVNLGFTFSFPVAQSSIASGRLLGWTKGFGIRGAVGKDVVSLLNEALAAEGLENIHTAALINDTVAVLAAKSYEDANCDIGVIIGTGTNACYRGKISNVSKWKGPVPKNGRMIVNIEWGNFDKLKRTPYDKSVDAGSNNRGEQMLEKMVSGMYLGKLAGLVLKNAAKKFDKIRGFRTEDMSIIESDASSGLRKIRVLLEKLGISGATLGERRLCREVCRLVSCRAARISAACMSAILTKIDPALASRHTIAIDGSVYEKHPAFAKNIKKTLNEIFGKDASRIRLALAKDGSGMGAAVVAAIAAL